MSNPNINHQIFLTIEEMFDTLGGQVEKLEDIIKLIDDAKLSNEEYDEYEPTRERFKKFVYQLEDIRTYLYNMMNAKGV